MRLADLRSLITGASWLGPIVAMLAFMLFSSVSDRGFNGSGLWQLEQTEAAASWIQNISDRPAEVWSDDSVRAGLSAETRRGPMIGLMPALVWLADPTDNVAGAARTTNSILICLTVLLVFGAGRRAGGLLAGLAATIALLCVPRVWAAATSPGMTAVALFAMTAGAVAIERSRDRFLWFVPAVLMLVFALLSTQLALFLILIWVYLVFFDSQLSEEPGLLPSRPLSPWGLLLFPVVLVLVVILFPAFKTEGVSGFLEYAKAFIDNDRVPTLYFGVMYGEHRLPWHAGLSMTALTTPPTVLFLTVFGFTVASPLTARIRRRLAKRLGDRAPKISQSGHVAPLRMAWAMLVLTAFIPLLLGATVSHGVDLLVLMTPWCALFAGIGLYRLMQVVAVRLSEAFAGRVWARLGTLGVVTILGWGVFIFAIKDAKDAYPDVESYYNWLVSGVDGAAEAGLPRYPNGPLPVDFLASLVGPEDQVTVAILGTQGPVWAILGRYQELGLVPSGLSSAPLQTADIVLLRYNEYSSEFYRYVPEFYAAARSNEAGSVRWLTREGLPLFGAVRLR